MFKNLLFLTGLLTAIAAQATLKLELTQGVDTALPVAIVYSAPCKMDQMMKINRIIHRDLENSGHFNIPHESDFEQHPSQIEQVDFSYWRSLGMDHLVMVSINQLNGRYQVKLTLFDLFRDQKDPLLLSQQFEVLPHHLTALGHHLSDLIYEKLIGKKGIFSTRIAYVLIHRPPNSAPIYRLEISDYDGHHPQTLLESSAPLMSPAWSPDGHSMAVVSFAYRRSQIIVINLKTGEAQTVSSAPGINGAPAWSPDGRRLAVVLSKTGDPKIYTLDLQSHHLAPLTHGFSIDTEPTWSPNGQFLIFTSNRGGSPQLYRLEIKTGAIERLTFSGNYNASASYAKEGKTLAFLHRDNQSFTIATQSIGSSGLTGTLRQLTISGLEKSPSMAPNGDMVVYATQYAGHDVLGMVSVDGGIKLRLPAREGDVQEPDWSPFLN